MHAFMGHLGFLGGHVVSWSFWVVVAFIWAVSQACVLSLCPAFMFVSLWPLLGLRPQLVSCVPFWVALALGLCPQLVSSACEPFYVAPNLIWAVSSACVPQLVS